MKFNEPTLNQVLAGHLETYGFAANPEVIIKEKHPDVLILIGGLKVILEGKNRSKKKKLQKQAKDRLKDGLCEISIAVLYESELYHASDYGALKKHMAEAVYDGFVFYWDDEGISEIPFEEQTIQDLAAVLDNVLSLYIKNDLLRKKIEEIDEVIGRLSDERGQSSLFFHEKTVKADLKRVLGLGGDDG